MGLRAQDMAVGPLCGVYTVCHEPLAMSLAKHAVKPRPACSERGGGGGAAAELDEGKCLQSSSSSPKSLLRARSPSNN